MSRKRSVRFCYIILTMFLARVLHTVYDMETSSDRREVLVETLKNPEKLAKTLMRIEFLTACRREKVSPRFIEDALQPVQKIFGSARNVQSKCWSFARSLLNESIAEAHRRKAYLIRQRNRQFASIHSFLGEERLSYILSTCEQVYDITVRENRPRLIQKFRRCQRLESKSVIRVREPSATSQKRVNNLSSLVLSEESLDLLSKGPNFAVTQKISQSVILEAEKGVERLAYAKRWQDAICKTNTQTSTSSTNSTTTNEAATSTSTPGDTDHPPNNETPTPTQAVSPIVDGVQAAVTNEPRFDSTTNASTTIQPPRTTTTDNNGAPVTATDSARRRAAPSRSGLSFRFPDTDKRFPPPSDIDVERKLKRLKEDIVKTYKSHKVDNSNVSDDQSDFLKNVHKNDDVIFKQSDKCKGFVIMDRDDYLTKSHTILDDARNYETLDKNPIPKVEAETKRIFRSISKGKLPDSTIQELTPSHSRIPVFYGLPKDHKESVPLRPVISACGGPTEKTSCLLERILHQLLKYVPTHLWDTTDFLKRLSANAEGKEIPQGSIFFSIDVVNLYGSIPISEAIDAAMEKLEAHCDEVDTFGLSQNDVKSLLEHCLNKNVFSFDNKFYRQTLGIAMGNSCAPPIAILFLDRFERRALENTNDKPTFFVRYIDDYAGIWTHGQQALLDFVAYLNSLHPTLRFTLEHSGGGVGVPFLDTLVTVVAHGGGATRIETELYIKPTNSGIILHYNSAHPAATKHNIVRNQFHRAIRNSSNRVKEEKSIEKIWGLLAQNGYPEKVLGRLLKEVQFKVRGTSGNVAKKGRNRGGDGFLCLPYVDEKLLCKIQSKVNKSGLNVKLAWRNPQKLKNKLIRSSLSKPRCPGGNRCHTCASGFSGDCTQKNVVYHLNCKLCHENGQKSNYVGETKRPVRLRFNEHVRNALNESEGTPMGDHFKECHSSTDVPAIPIELKILYKSRDHPDRKIAESLLIKRNCPELNSNLSSWPIL